MASEINRRDFLKLTGAGAAGSAAGCYTQGGGEAPKLTGGSVQETAPDVSTVQIVADLYEEFHAAASKDSLNEPEDLPAVGFTNVGIYQWTEGDGDWQLTDLLKGTATNPKKGTHHYEGLATDNLDNIEFVPHPTVSNINSAIDNVGAGGTVWAAAPDSGRHSFGSEINIDKEITLVIDGHIDTTHGGNLFKISADFVEVFVAEVVGPGEGTAGSTFCEFTGGNNNAKVHAMSIQSFERGFFFNAGAAAVLDHIIDVSHMDGFVDAFDFFADGNNVEGVFVNGVTVFDVSGKTVKHRGTSNSIWHGFFGTTLHGATDGSNTAEIDENDDGNNAGDKNIYLNRFVGGATTVNSATWLVDVNGGTFRLPVSDPTAAGNPLAILNDLFSPSLNTNYILPFYQMQKASGGGSVTFTDRQIQLREPGAASSAEESVAFDDITEFDPSISGRVRIHLSNITIDDDNDAQIRLQVDDKPSVDKRGDDVLEVTVTGDGSVSVATAEDGTVSASTDSSQNNAYVSALNWVEIDWDGATLTARTDDGTTEVSVSEAGNYPSGENLFLKISARDNDGTEADKVDFDVDAIEVGS